MKTVLQAIVGWLAALALLASVPLMVLAVKIVVSPLFLQLPSVR